MALQTIRIAPELLDQALKGRTIFRSFELPQTAFLRLMEVDRETGDLVITYFDPGLKMSEGPRVVCLTGLEEPYTVSDMDGFYNLRSADEALKSK